MSPPPTKSICLGSWHCTNRIKGSIIVFNFSQLKVSDIVNGFTYITGALCAIAVIGHVHLFYVLLFVAMVALSAHLASKGILFPRWLLTVFSVAVIAFFLLQINMQNFISHMMEALLVLLGIKFLERRQVRDYMQIYALALFILAGLGLLTLSMIFILHLLTFVFLLSLSLVFLTFYSQDPELELTNQTIKKMIVKCIWIPLLAIPLSAAMFVIIPRTHYPILTFLNRPDTAKTGFTDNVRLGQVSSIQEDESVLFRVTMERIDDGSLYWRGITLDHFDGVSWKNTVKKPYSPTSSRSPAGKSIRQTVYLEPYQNSYIFALDKPVYIDLRGVKKNADHTFAMPGPIERRVRYDALSTVSETIPEEGDDLKAYLQMPANLPAGIIPLVNELSVEGDAERTARNVHDHFRGGHYGYSLTDLPVTKNPLEDFLFITRYGNCEYFASAMAVMLRLSGIPSRLVGGYLGGYYNAVGGYYLVPQKNAHVWVEAHIEGRGWVRFDPTPAQAEGLSSFRGQGVFFRARIFFDTINYYWYGIILTYNLQKQVSMARSLVMELKKPSFDFSLPKVIGTRYFAFILIFAGLVISLWFLVASIKSREKKILDNFLKELKKSGYEKKEHEGLEEFLQTIDDEGLKRKALEFARAYEEIYYRDRRFSASDLKRLKDLSTSLTRDV